MSMDVKSIGTFQSDMMSVLRSVQATRSPVLLVSEGKPQAVLQDVTSYQRTQDAIVLMKMMLQSERYVARDKGSSTREVGARLRARLSARKKSDNR